MLISKQENKSEKKINGITGRNVTFFLNTFLIQYILVNFGYNCDKLSVCISQNWKIYETCENIIKF